MGPFVAPPVMKSIRAGLRAGDIEKDTYGRLSCTTCGSSLNTRKEEGTLGSVRACPDCGSEWQEI